MFNVTFKGMDVENVQKGKNRYQVGTVNYEYKGEPRQQKIMSFANPQVFKDLQGFTNGDVIGVETTKNGNFTNWSKVEKANGNAAPAVSGTPTTGKVLGSQYETRDERVLRQLHIVRQSSLAQAVASLTPGAKAALDPAVVLERAQQYVDWVYGTEETLGEMGTEDQTVPEE
jgi:hypothetical protein